MDDWITFLVTHHETAAEKVLHALRLTQPLSPSIPPPCGIRWVFVQNLGNARTKIPFPEVIFSKRIKWELAMNLSRKAYHAG